MRRSGLKAWISFLLLFAIFHIVDDEGAGEGVDDIGNFHIVDDEGAGEGVDESDNKTTLKEEQSVIDKEIAELKAFKEEQEGKEATALAINSLIEKYPDFDANSIATHLSSIAKEHGEDEAEKFNNPLGWENIYLTNFKKEPTPETLFDRGRGETKEPFDFKKGYERANSGESDAIAELLENSKG